MKTIRLSTPRGLCLVERLEDGGHGVEMPYISISECCDILARIPRFGGVPTVLYTVADHALAMKNFLLKISKNGQIPPYVFFELSTFAFFHDIAEVITGDIKSPLKSPEQYGIECAIRRKMMSMWMEHLPPLEATFGLVKDLYGSLTCMYEQGACLDRQFSRAEHSFLMKYDYDSDKKYDPIGCYNSDKWAPSKIEKEYRTTMLISVMEQVGNAEYIQNSMHNREAVDLKSNKLKQEIRKHIQCLTKKKTSEEAFRKLGL